MRSHRSLSRWSVLAVLGAVLVGSNCGGPTGVDLTQPASLTLIPSEATIDAIGGTQAMSATVRDALGGELGAAEVTWAVADGAVISVDGDGLVTALTQGRSDVTATAGELTRTSTITVLQIPSRIDIVSGDQQSGVAASTLADPLTVQINDRLGEPVEGAVVQFSIALGTGTLSVSEMTTGADGRASTEFTIGTVAGDDYEVVARVTTGSAGSTTFRLTAEADVPTSIGSNGGDSQRQPVNAALLSPIVVRVSDQFGNGVPGIDVTFVVGTGGGTVDPATAATDEAGDARTVWTLGGVLGDQTVDATTGGVPGSTVTFTAVGTDLAITSITPDTLVEGAAAQIVGTGFDAVAANDSVVIDGMIAAVTGASPTQLDIVVPKGACRPEGPVELTVSTPGGGTTPTQTKVLRPDPVALAVGEQLIVQDPNDFCLQFSATTDDEQYLFGVQSTSQIPTGLTSGIVRVRANGTTTAVARARQAGGRGTARPPTARRERWARHRLAEADLRARAQRAVRPHMGRPSGITPVVHELRVDSNVTVGQSVSFKFPSLLGNLCTESVTVRATVKAVGRRGIWLDDDDNPGGGFTDADYQALSDRLDDVVYGPDVEYFGDPTDLDENDRIVVLVTAEINKVSSGILAFVSPADLFDTEFCPASNLAEVYYGRAPDPSGTVGGFQYTRDDALADAPVLIAHEFAHVIQDGRRLIDADTAFMALFMAEGQATLAEEVVGFADLGNGVGQNLGPSLVTHPSTWHLDGFTDISYFFGRNDLVPDESVNGAPHQCAWMARDPSPCQGRALWYGVTYSFLRWISDRFGATFPGGEAAIQRALTANDLRGLENIEDVLGVPVDSLLAQWSAALYVDDRIPGAAAPLTFPSWNYQQIFENGSFPASARLVPETFSFAGIDGVAFGVRSGSTQYYLLEGARDPTAIRVRDGANLPLSDEVQVYLVRTR